MDYVFSLPPFSGFEAPLVFKAYPASQWPIWTVIPEGKPSGSPVSEGTVEAGTVPFKGLTEDEKYFAGLVLIDEEAQPNIEYWFWYAFWAESPKRSASGDQRAVEETGERLFAHASATKEAHGVTDFSALLKAPSKVETYTQTFASASRTHAEAELPTSLSALTLLVELITNVNKTNKAVNELKKIQNAIIDDLQATGIAK